MLMITIGRRIILDCEELLDEHAQIDRLSHKLEELARSPHPEPVLARSLLRDLARVVAAHLRKEESFVYPGLASVTDGHEAPGLILDFEAMKQSWEEYLATWQQAGALSEWQRFGADTVVALQGLRERALKEVDQLYALGLREGLVTLRQSSRRTS